MSYKMKRGINYAHEDQIWKNHIASEQMAAKLWPKNWGFLSHEYAKFNFKQSRQSESAASQKLVRMAAEGESYPLKLPPLKPAPEFKGLPFPKTTAREVGWRSAYRSCCLEKYSSYAKSRGNLLKSLNWPPDAVV
ncbi:ciliary microtubule inner protein 1-like [Corticium candelabrum]|uniref:ciliary microtubule inner protein 1-like n=1 Tax=Corticium candelabrum TaxID=121492 RepID=UPI002E25E729|nr:ciliary microtubule inner protein 1-like [Corticium candelabrum]